MGLARRPARVLLEQPQGNAGDGRPAARRAWNCKRGGCMGLLSRRRRRPEVMDQPRPEPARHVRALRGLARINYFSGSAGILWRPLEALGREPGPAPCASSTWPRAAATSRSGCGDGCDGPGSTGPLTAATSALSPWSTPAGVPPGRVPASGSSSTTPCATPCRPTTMRSSARCSCTTSTPTRPAPSSGGWPTRPAGWS